jgi:hypothetical protein
MVKKKKTRKATGKPSEFEKAARAFGEGLGTALGVSILSKFSKPSPTPTDFDSDDPDNPFDSHCTPPTLRK